MKKHILSLVGILLLAGCSKTGVPERAGSISIDASIGAMTKAPDDGDKTSFAAGDRITLYGWLGSASEVPDTRVVNGVNNTLGTDGKWTPDSPMYWALGGDAHYFLAVYPVRSIARFTEDVYVLNPYDNRSSDLLVATNLDGVKAADGPVELAFTHVMAKLTVNLKFRSEFGGTPSVSGVTVNVKDMAKVNFLTKAVTAMDGMSSLDIPAAAQAPSGYALSYSGIQVPQEGLRKISVSIGGQDYVYESAEDIPLTSGKATSLGLIVGKDKVELGTIKVSDWAAGTVLPDGEAEWDPFSGHDYVDMGNGHMWATCNVGAMFPHNRGGIFAWGETTPKESYTEDNYLCTQYDDAARQLWGGAWHTPTEADWYWLLTNGEWLWTEERDGISVMGMTVTSKINGNTIFLPGTGYNTLSSSSMGYYWSSTLATLDRAWMLYFSSGELYMPHYYCYYGMAIRPVIVF